MHDTTKQRLTDDLVAWGYVILLVDSYATRGIEHACTSTAFATVISRTRDAYGALVFLARQTFVDPQRVAAVGFPAGAWVTLSVAEPNSFELFVPPSNLRFQAAAAFYPPCQQAAARPAIPTLIFIGTLDDWTPAADCSNKVAAWGNDGPPIELVVYPGAHHSFYYALSARQDHVGSLAGIQRRGSGQCKSPPAPVSRSPSQLKARRQRQSAAFCREQVREGALHSARNAVKTFGLWSHHEIPHGLGNDARMRAHRIVSGVLNAHNRQIFHIVFQAVDTSRQERRVAQSPDHQSRDIHAQ
jgi:dienelactone hydrolase